MNMNKHLIIGFCISFLFFTSLFSSFAFNPNNNNEKIQPQTVIPLCNRDYFDYLHAELKNATNSIHIVQFEMRYYPNFTNSHVNILLNDFIEANRRGVDVKVILEGGEDFLGENFTESQKEAKEYLENNDVEVKFDGKGITTHTKLVIIDNSSIIIGSTNWNYYSLDRNNEASILIESDEIGRYYEDYFQRLWTQWDIKINEFMPDPAGYDDAPMPRGEWVELYNTGSEELNVSGWVIYNSYDSHELFITPENTNTSDTIVPPNGFLVVYRNGDADFSVNNRGYEEVRLYDSYPPSKSTPIDNVSYNGSEENKSWARIPDGTGNFHIRDPTPGRKNKGNENFDTGSGTYPSIPGTHNGTITPNQTITVSKLYTYPCPGTGGHTEYARIWNATWNATATWNGYAGNWHNITFAKTVILLANETYNYTIITSSYPQIHHTSALLTANGCINCTNFYSCEWAHIHIHRLDSCNSSVLIKTSSNPLNKERT